MGPGSEGYDGGLRTIKKQGPTLTMLAEVTNEVRKMREFNTQTQPSREG